MQKCRQLLCRLRPVIRSVDIGELPVEVVHNITMPMVPALRTGTMRMPPILYSLNGRRRRLPSRLAKVEKDMAPADNPPHRRLLMMRLCRLLSPAQQRRMDTPLWDTTVQPEAKGLSTIMPMEPVPTTGIKMLLLQPSMLISNKQRLQASHSHRVR